MRTPYVYTVALTLVGQDADVLAAFDTLQRAKHYVFATADPTDLQYRRKAYFQITRFNVKDPNTA